MEIFERAFDSFKQGAAHVTDSVCQLFQRQAQNNDTNTDEVQGSATDGQPTNDNDINVGSPLTTVPSRPPHYDDVPILRQPASSYNSLYRLFSASGSAWTLPSSMRPPAYVSQDVLPAYASSVGEPRQRGIERGIARQTWSTIANRITQTRIPFGPLPTPRFLALAITPTRSASTGPSTPTPPAVIIQPIENRPRRLDVLPARWKLGWIVGGAFVLTGLGVVFWMVEQNWEKEKQS